MFMDNRYFDWMCNIAMPDPSDRFKYRYLLDALNSSLFYFTIPMDENRLVDGIDLRNRFLSELGYANHISIHNENSCSMLEMMVALSIKGDEHILYDYETGSKADYIFRSMLESLDFLCMTNDVFNPDYFEFRINILLNHEYDYDGKGGLFTIKNPRKDIREVDIWYQMNWYIQELYEKK